MLENTLPKVTVVIVNWNGAEFLERCLVSVMAQTVAPYEVILVDNASEDSSLDIVRQFPLVSLLEQNINLGFARANNIAIEAASTASEWIALLNPDAFADPRWLEALLAAAQANPDVSFFGSKLLTAADIAVLDGAGDAYHVSGLVWRMGHGENASMFPQQECEVFSPCAAAAMYKRYALQEIGGFDEDFFCYVEDVDLGFRLRLAGHRCLYIPTSVAVHVGSGTTGGQHSDFALYYGHRNLVWTYLKNMPNTLFWFFLPLHLAMNLLALMIFSCSGQGWVILRAKLDAVLGIPKMWDKRRQLQLTSKISWRAMLRVMTKGFR